MKLVVTEKNDAAQKIADLLGVKKPKAEKQEEQQIAQPSLFEF